MRLVLDTNALISAIGWRGKPRKILEMCILGKHRLIESPVLLNELYIVLKRPKFDFISSSDKEALITALITWSEIVIPEKKLEIIMDDPIDNIVLECALAGQADFIISGDSHLLSLKKFKSISIISPDEFIKI